MGYRLIALDIDGTIQTAEHPLAERTRQAVARVMDRGVAITLATGRMFRSARESGAALGITTPIVSFQGAQITDPTTGELLWHRPLTAEMAREALDALAPSGLPSDMEIMAYYEETVYVGEMTPRSESYGKRNQIEVKAVGDLKEVADMELTRLVVVGGEDEIQRLETSLIARFDSRLYVTRSLPHFCEILHPLGGKDRALEWLCEYLGVRREETVAFGNGYNDVRMLEWVSLGIAIGGAVPEVLAVADRVAPPLEEDGAAQVLEELLDAGLIG